jgi:hypothetical protein
MPRHIVERQYTRAIADARAAFERFVKGLTEGALEQRPAPALFAAETKKDEGQANMIMRRAATATKRSARRGAQSSSVADTNAV